MNNCFEVDEIMRLASSNEESDKHLISIFKELRYMFGESEFDQQYVSYGCESWTNPNNQILLKVKCELENYGYFVEMKRSSNNTDYYLLIS